MNFFWNRKDEEEKTQEQIYLNYSNDFKNITNRYKGDIINANNKYYNGNIINMYQTKITNEFERHRAEINKIYREYEKYFKPVTKEQKKEKERELREKEKERELREKEKKRELKEKERELKEKEKERELREKEKYNPSNENYVSQNNLSNQLYEQTIKINEENNLPNNINNHFNNNGFYDYNNNIDYKAKFEEEQKRYAEALNQFNRENILNRQRFDQETNALKEQQNKELYQMESNRKNIEQKLNEDLIEQQKNHNIQSDIIKEQMKGIEIQKIEDIYNIREEGRKELSKEKKQHASALHAINENQKYRVDEFAQKINDNNIFYQNRLDYLEKQNKYNFNEYNRNIEILEKEKL